MYLKGSDCLKTETVVNVGAICQYNYGGERSVFINKQDQFFFPKGKWLLLTENPGLEIQCTYLGLNLKR